LALVRPINILKFIRSKEIMDAFRPKVYFDMVSDLRNSISQIAEMITGGIDICSMNEQGRVYAHTTIQIDGDVMIAFPPDIIDKPDFETLTKRHMEKVVNSLEPLTKLSLCLKHVKRKVRGIGMICALLSAINLCLPNSGSMGRQISVILLSLLDNFWEFFPFLLSLFLMVSGQLVSKIILIIAKSQAKHFTDKAKKEILNRYL